MTELLGLLGLVLYVVAGILGCGLALVGILGLFSGRNW